MSEADLSLTPVDATEGGRLSRAGRLWVLETEGDGATRGRAHGTLLRAAIAAGVVPDLAERAARVVTQAAGAAARPLVDQIYAGIRADVPPEMLAELAGIAAGAGLAEEAVFRASYLSEALQLLAALRAAARPQAQAAGACTAAVATGRRTADGAALHAKNQDYDGGGLWDAQPLVHVARPADGLAFVTATSAGLIKGNLALNAACVTIGGHFLFSTQPGPSGPGFTTLERQVALHARTADEALALVRARPVTGSFAFVITDRGGAAYVAECDGAGVAVRPAEDGVLAMTNLFLAAADRDGLRPYGAHRNPEGRRVRIEHLLAGLAGPARPETLAGFLADRFDAVTGRRRGPATAAIAQPSTVTTAVAETGAARFWVADGTTPTAHGTYIGFDLTGPFAGTGPVALCGRFAAGAPEDAGAIAGFRRYLEARNRSQTADTASLDALLAEAEALDPQEPAYPRFRARLALRRAEPEAAAPRHPRSGTSTTTPPARRQRA